MVYDKSLKYGIVELILISKKKTLSKKKKDYNLYYMIYEGKITILLLYINDLLFIIDNLQYIS